MRNPFLQIIATIGDEDEVEQPPPPPGAQQQRPGKVQLGKFWPQAPYAWFAAAELKFEVANITGERERFTYAVSAMGFNMLQTVMVLVENLPAVNPHTTLKDRLVLAHQLTLVRKATRCLQVVARGNQRPSEVLASLLEYCPPGEEGTAFFRAAFTMHVADRPEGAGPDGRPPVAVPHPPDDGSHPG